MFTSQPAVVAPEPPVAPVTRLRYTPLMSAGIVSGVVVVLQTIAAIAAGEATQAATAISAALVRAEETNLFFMIMSRYPGK